MSKILNDINSALEIVNETLKNEYGSNALRQLKIILTNCQEIAILIQNEKRNIYKSEIQTISYARGFINGYIYSLKEKKQNDFINLLEIAEDSIFNLL